MKASQTLIESIGDMKEVATTGDFRRIVGNVLLALVRKEISATDAETIAKLVDTVSNNMNSEVKVAKISIELRAQGANLGNVMQLGQMLAINPPKADPAADRESQDGK